MHPLRIMLFLSASLLFAGCSSRTATFPGFSDPEVWNAMVTVAKNPEYKDWFVFENEVWMNRPTGEIEVHRFLRRDLVRVGQDPERQEERWKFQITFEHTDPPTIMFTARQVKVPAHLWREADRYFADMRNILGIGPEAEAGEIEVIDLEVTEVQEVPADEGAADELLEVDVEFIDLDGR
jgi:hypothetical protein